MPYWARVVNGVVQEPAIELPTGENPSQYFSNVLEGTWYSTPNGTPTSGWTRAGNGTYTAPVPLEQGPRVRASAALLGGFTVTSTAHPEIDGMYAVDPTSQMRIQAVSVYILQNSNFPGNSSTFGWSQLDGTRVQFPSVDVFQAWATAIADYVSTLDRIVFTDEGELPSSEVEIA